ncbi:MAG: methyl-accepting chemotaxis protein, partial [Natronospirillum sp.]
MLTHLPVRHRLALAFGLVLLLFVLWSVFSLSRLAASNDQINIISQQRVPGLIAVNEINDRFSRLQVPSTALVFSGSAADRSVLLEQIELMRESLNSAKTAYLESALTEQEQALFDRYAELEAQFFVQLGEAVTLTENWRGPDAVRLRQEQLIPIAEQATGLLRELIRYNTNLIQTSEHTAQAAYTLSRSLTVLMLAVVAIVLTLMAYLLIRSINGPLKEAMRVANSIAHGDLSTEINVQGKDELAQLKSSLSVMQYSLRTAVEGINQSAVSLANAAEQLSGVTDQSQQDAQRQNTELEQAATAVNQLTVAIAE